MAALSRNQGLIPTNSAGKLLVQRMLRAQLAVASSTLTVAVSPDPAAGAISAGQPLQVDAVDLGSQLRRVVVMAYFPTLKIKEVVWDGDRFSHNYLRNGTQAGITNGTRLVFLRDAGWPEAPTLKVVGYDKIGTEV
jgi:hypothetical protein